MVCNIPIQADRRSLQQFLCRICGDITLTESYHSVEGQHDQDHSKASFLFQMQCNESERMWSSERAGKSKPLAQMLGNLMVGIASFPCYGILVMPWSKNTKSISSRYHDVDGVGLLPGNHKVCVRFRRWYIISARKNFLTTYRQALSWIRFYRMLTILLVSAPHI